MFFISNFLTGVINYFFVPLFAFFISIPERLKLFCDLFSNVHSRDILLLVLMKLYNDETLPGVFTFNSFIWCVKMMASEQTVVCFRHEIGT